MMAFCIVGIAIQSGLSLDLLLPINTSSERANMHFAPFSPSGFLYGYVAADHNWKII